MKINEKLVHSKDMRKIIMELLKMQLLKLGKEQEISCRFFLKNSF